MTIRTVRQEGNQQTKEYLKEYEKKIKVQTATRQEYNKRLMEKNVKIESICKIGSDFESRWMKTKKKVFEEVSRQCQ